MKIRLKNLSLSNKVKYSALGVILGLLFPALGILFQNNEARIYIIATAPIVLGSLFYFIGVRQQKITELAGGLKSTKKDLEQNNTQMEIAEVVGKYGSWELDVETYTSTWSKGFYTVLGMKSGELPANFGVFLEMIDSVNRSRIYEEVAEAIKNPANEVNINGIITIMDGSKRYIRGSGQAICDKKGKAIKVVGTIQDITDLKMAQEKANTYLNALDQAAIVAITDAKGKIIFANDKFSNISGFSIEELIGKDHRILNSGHHSKEFFKNMWQTIVSGHPWHGEVCNKDKNGRLYWVDTTIVPTLTMDGEVIQYVAIRYEITQKKMAELELLEAKNKAEASHKKIEAAEIIGKFGNWELTLRDRSFSYSKGFSRILDFPEDAQITFEEFISLLLDEDREMLEQAMEETIMTQQPFSFDYRVKLKNGEIKWLRGEGQPINDDRGMPIKLVGTVQDVNDKMKNEIELTAATLRADAATRAKSDFLANMSHEIRTPMNGVIGMCNLLLSNVKDSVQKEQLQIISNCGNTLLDLINDILDFSKIEAGKIELENEPFNIHDVTHEIIQLMNSRASEKGVALLYRNDPTVSSWFLGDTTRFRQILTNLISNAVKFTENGSVIVSSKASKKDDGLYEIEFSVKDSGIGISAEVQSKLFSSFSQADASTTRKFGGSGLGLAICKGLCEKMGGRIWLESEPGCGSTFSFTMLLAETGEQEARQPNVVTIDSEMAQRHPLNILIAEDNRVNQLVAVGFLQKLGYRPDVAANGIEVLNLLKNKSYDIIFMDNHMPEMDGLATTRKIYEDYPESVRPDIVALTASVMKEDIDRCMGAGMKDYITKPVQINELIRVLNNVVPKEERNFEIENNIVENSVAVSSAVGDSKSNTLSFNIETFMANFHGMEDLAIDMVSSFLQTLPKLINDIEKAVADKSDSDLELSAHTLKGALSNFHAESARDLAWQLEQMGRNKQINEALKILSQLRTELDRLDVDLQNFMNERRAA